MTIAVLANDTDADGDALVVSGVTQGTYGTVVANPDGTVTYSPNVLGGLVAAVQRLGLSAGAESPGGGEGGRN